VTGALQDHDRAYVVGETTFGKALVQSVYRISGGAGLALTTAHYYTPSGRLIQRDYSKSTDQNDYVTEAYKQDAPSDSALATMPKFKTAGGRVVYGGGGILPDVVIPDRANLTRVEGDMIQKRVFFEWATHYVTHHKDTKWTTASLGPQFKLNESDWSDLKKIMDNRKVAVDSVWTSDRPFMMQQVRAEIAAATLGPLDRYRILVEDDPQLNMALQLFPQATKLLAGNYDAVGDKNGKPVRIKTPETANGPKSDKN
jgi:carboxyl-terminal processing protease